MTALSFFVPGAAVQKGSKRAFQPGWKPGQMERPRVVLAEDSRRDLEGWMRSVKYAALAARGANWTLLDGPVWMDLCFWFVRPKSHFTKAGMLRDDAPHYHIVKPDRDKLERAICDALTGVLWTDDSRVADGPISKRYVNVAGMPGVHITVEGR